MRKVPLCYEPFTGAPPGTAAQYQTNGLWREMFHDRGVQPSITLYRSSLRFTKGRAAETQARSPAFYFRLVLLLRLGFCVGRNPTTAEARGIDLDVRTSPRSSELLLCLLGFQRAIGEPQDFCQTV